MFDGMPTPEETARSVKEQQILHEELWEVIEKAVTRWEPDEAMTDKVIAATLMTIATTFGGDMLAMVANAVGMRGRGALERGADLIREGALTVAIKSMQDLQGLQGLDESTRH